MIINIVMGEHFQNTIEWSYKQSNIVLFSYNMHLHVRNDK